MSSYEWIDKNLVNELETNGLITSTFLRLGEDRRIRVLDALFVESSKLGPERINIKDVAKTAGVPVGSLYQYFGDRERLARCATILVSRKLTGDLEGFIPYLEALPLREALTLYLKSSIEWSINEAASLRSFVASAYGSSAKGSVFADSTSDGGDWYAEALVRPVAAAILTFVRRMLAAAAARGELRPGIDLDAAARLANVLMIAVADARMMPGLDRYYRLYGSGSPDSRLEEAVDFICRSVGR